MKYTTFSEEFADADETKVFEMTGCLSNCDAYQYSIEHYGNVEPYKHEPDTREGHDPLWMNNTLLLEFFFQSAEYELRDEVRYFFRNVNLKNYKSKLICSTSYMMDML